MIHISGNIQVISIIFAIKNEQHIHSNDDIKNTFEQTNNNTEQKRTGDKNIQGIVNNKGKIINGDKLIKQRQTINNGVRQVKIKIQGITKKQLNGMKQVKIKIQGITKKQLIGVKQVKMKMHKTIKKQLHNSILRHGHGIIIQEFSKILVHNNNGPQAQARRILVHNKIHTGIGITIQLLKKQQIHSVKHTNGKINIQIHGKIQSVYNKNVKGNIHGQHIEVTHIKALHKQKYDIII